MYLNGPASGGGVTRQVREVIAVASVLMPRALTAERVRAHYAGVVKGRVDRYVLPHLGTLNFVLHDALGGGVTRSLALDAHGKCLSSAFLSLAIESLDRE